jgi:hypothetical protein
MPTIYFVDSFSSELDGRRCQPQKWSARPCGLVESYTCLLRLNECHLQFLVKDRDIIVSSAILDVWKTKLHTKQGNPITFRIPRQISSMKVHVHVGPDSEREPSFHSDTYWSQKYDFCAKIKFLQIKNEILHMPSDTNVATVQNLR